MLIDRLLQSGDTHAGCYADYLSKPAPVSEKITHLREQEIARNAERYRWEAMQRTTLLSEAAYEQVMATLDTGFDHEGLHSLCKEKQSRLFEERCLDGDGRHRNLSEVLVQELSAMGRGHQHVEATNQYFGDAYRCVSHTFRYVYPDGETSDALYRVEAVVDGNSCAVIKKYVPVPLD